MHAHAQAKNYKLYFRIATKMFINLKTGFTGAGELQLECPGYTLQQFNKNFTNTKDIDLGEVSMVAV